jgi:hypothetical protein
MGETMTDHYWTAIAAAQYYLVAGCRCGWTYHSNELNIGLTEAMEQHQAAAVPGGAVGSRWRIDAGDRTVRIACTSCDWEAHLDSTAEEAEIDVMIDDHRAADHIGDEDDATPASIRPLRVEQP